MSSGNFESSVELVLRPSRSALMMALWVHALPAALLPFTGLAPSWMMGLAGLIALSWIALRHHPALGFGKRAITRIRWEAEGQWFIWRGGKRIAAELLDDSVVHPRMVVLRFKIDTGKRVTRLLTGDETTPGNFRRLKARLTLPR